MTTDENARLNLQTAIQNVRARMKLSDTPADWSYDERIAYNKALAAEILSYSQSFTPAMVSVATTVQASNPSALEDDSFDLGQFAAETASNAVPVLDGFTNKLIVGAVLVAALYFGIKAYQAKAAAA